MRVLMIVVLCVSSVESAELPVRLVTATREQQLRQLLPRVTDSKMQTLLDDKSLILYTEHEMLRAYQFEGTVHSAFYNISANGGEPFGNANREFPWGAPGGTHRSKSVSAFRFMRLPLDEAGKPWPIVTWLHSGTRGNVDSWVFPVGTTFGEVLCISNPGPGTGDYCFEIRTRERIKGGRWEVEAYRPFTEPQELVDKVKELRPDWRDKPALVAFCQKLEQSRQLQRMHLVDFQPVRNNQRGPGRLFNSYAGQDKLPALPVDLVRDLLTQTPFKPVSGTVWYSSDDVNAYAPTTDAAFHIVPANYDAAFISVDSSSCMRCHDSTNQAARSFNPPRDWYGNVRGSDGILSFHPYDPSCISPNGVRRTKRLRPEFVKANIVVKYNPATHPADMYHLLDGFNEDR